MAKLTNYLKVIKDYWNTPKGRHDIIDYLRAILIVILLSIIISLVLAYFL